MATKDPARIARRTAITLLRSAFLVSLIFSILNISINESSVYFFMFIPFLDLPFLKFVWKSRYSSISIASLASLLALLLPLLFYDGFLKLMIKPFWLAAVIFYTYHLWLKDYATFKWLYILTCVSVCFSGLQLASVYLGIEQALYPTTISKAIWGKYAILARPGFEDGIIFPFRFAGLSKEPGFFSSLLLSVFILQSRDKKIPRILRKIVIFCAIAGLMLSLSKITMVFVGPAIIVYILNRYMLPLHKIPLIVGVAAFLMLASYLTSLLYEKAGLIALSYINPWLAETYLHRTIGYYLFQLMNDSRIVEIFFFGSVTQRVQDVLQVIPFLHNLRFVRDMPDVVFFSSGTAYILFQYGVFFLAGYLLFLGRLGVKFDRYLIFLLMIANVNPFAFENFVIIGYLGIVPMSAIATQSEVAKA